MTRLPVVDHLKFEEIDRRYRTCPDPAEKTRWHVLWLVARPGQPLSATAAAKLVGFTPAWGRAILRRYNARGPGALADGRRANGTDPKLTPEQQAELFAALQTDPPDRGLWSGPKVAAWMARHLGLARVHPQRGWEALKRIGWSVQAPRPEHPARATAEEREAFKKGSFRVGCWEADCR